MTVDRPCVIVVVDDAVLIREGVRQLLLAGGCDVVATATDVDGLDAALAGDPGGRPGPGHPDATGPQRRGHARSRAAPRRGSALGILLLSMYASPTLAVRALSAGGATGYLLKERITDGKALVAAVRTIVGGRHGRRPRRGRPAPRLDRAGPGSSTR